MKDHAYSRLMLAIKPHQAISRSQGVSGTNIYHPAHQLFVVLVLGGGSVWACASFHITLCQTSPTLAFVFIASPCRHAYTITWTRLHTTGSNACNQARSSNHKVCQEQRYITKLITWFEWSFWSSWHGISARWRRCLSMCFFQHHFGFIQLFKMWRQKSALFVRKYTSTVAGSKFKLIQLRPHPSISPCRTWGWTSVRSPPFDVAVACRDVLESWEGASSSSKKPGFTIGKWRF